MECSAATKVKGWIKLDTRFNELPNLAAKRGGGGGTGYVGEEGKGGGLKAGLGQWCCLRLLLALGVH